MQQDIINNVKSMLQYQKMLYNLLHQLVEEGKIEMIEATGVLSRMEFCIEDLQILLDNLVLSHS